MSHTETVSMPALQNDGSLPEQGQLVEVRRRQRTVNDVGASTFGDAFAPTRQGLVSLVSVDEDSLSEVLQVVWQLEPGARVLERAGLPSISGCDDAARLEAFLDAVSWAAAPSQHRSLCFTDIYTLFHDSRERSEDVAQLRASHAEMDQAVGAAYGWSDLDLGHGFHETKLGVRYTLSPPVCRTVLDLLLQLNH